MRKLTKIGIGLGLATGMMLVGANLPNKGAEIMRLENEIAILKQEKEEAEFLYDNAQMQIEEISELLFIYMKELEELKSQVKEHQL